MLRIAPHPQGEPLKKVSVFQYLVKLRSIEEGLNHGVVVFMASALVLQNDN